MFQPSSGAIPELKTMRNRIAPVGRTAPQLMSKEGYGQYPGLDKWKGKVVLIDFFAHWCGPCRQAFPDLEKLYAELHPKGLEIVGYTGFYGYYGSESGLSKDQEFKRMSGFIKKFNIPWTIQFGNDKTLADYGVTGIPQVVLIDKAGNVSELHVGYDKDGLPALRKGVEGLLRR